MILPVEAWMDLRRYKPLRDAGATWREIADEVGLDWRTVKQVPVGRRAGRAAGRAVAEGRGGPQDRRAGPGGRCLVGRRSAAEGRR